MKLSVPSRCPLRQSSSPPEMESERASDSMRGGVKLRRLTEVPRRVKRMPSSLQSGLTRVRVTRRICSR